MLKYVDGKVESPFTYVYIDDKGKITHKKIINRLIAPIREGDKIGVVEYFMDGKKIGERDIIAKKNVRKADYIDYFSKILVKFCA